MGKFIAVFGGLIAMAGGILLAVFIWWREFYELVFGMIPPLLFFIGGNIFILVTEKKSGVLFYRPVKFPGFFPSDAAYLISKELITKIMGGMSGTLSDWQSYGRLHGKDILYLLRKKI